MKKIERVEKALKHSNDIKREKKVLNLNSLEKKNTFSDITASIDTKGVIKGYASVFGIIDNHNDIIKRGAFIKSLKERMATGDIPKMLWQHEMEKPIGYWSKIAEDERGLYVEGQLLLDIEQGREAYSLIKKAIVEGLSIGFVVKDERIDQINGTREITDLDLVEISLVTMPANPSAKITSVKSKDGINANNKKNSTSNKNNMSLLSAINRIKEMAADK